MLSFLDFEVIRERQIEENNIMTEATLTDLCEMTRVEQDAGAGSKYLDRKLNRELFKRQHQSSLERERAKGEVSF